ncbi:MAG: hypothetical protein PUP92_01640 [Rhizonema sp. PD38]|nr:hypothetical protein [Rhizonema sp. PD38]
MILLGDKAEGSLHARRSLTINHENSVTQEPRTSFGCSSRYFQVRRERKENVRSTAAQSFHTFSIAALKTRFRVDHQN